ncbi:MAG: SCO1664 family protein [Anaerolineales bacterium]|nr:SCO1664 family protein [Anaerolineales bacterium]
MSVSMTETQVLEVLRQGKMEEKGLLPYSSNHSFLVVMRDGDVTAPAVYKPQRGESPLWDFEYGTLCKREAAAFAISDKLGWDLVPPTVLREGTRGLGSIQLYIDHDPDRHYFTAAEDARFSVSFRQLALFDFVVNNADRKSGHCLIGGDQRIWAIDHGICFHTDYKLRTVIWEFSCEAIEPAQLEDLHSLRSALTAAESSLIQQLRHLLNRQEVAATLRRLEHVLRTGTYPAPIPQRRNYPWPPI